MRPPEPVSYTHLDVYKRQMPLALAEEDPIIATELAAVVDELQFQLADLERETDRRLPGWLGELDSVATIALNEWRQQLRDCNYADATQ